VGFLQWSLIGIDASTVTPELKEDLKAILGKPVLRKIEALQQYLALSCLYGEAQPNAAQGNEKVPAPGFEKLLEHTPCERKDFASDKDARKDEISSKQKEQRHHEEKDDKHGHHGHHDMEDKHVKDNKHGTHGKEDRHDKDNKPGTHDKDVKHDKDGKHGTHDKEGKH